jgi:SulP family sulfate permease
MISVDQIDISGVHALESIVRSLRGLGGDLFMMRTQEPVMEMFKTTGFYEYIGDDHFLSPSDAIENLFYHVLDPAICIYECEARAFKECLNLPRPMKDSAADVVPLTGLTGEVESVTPLALWNELHQRTPPIVVDIREPREYHQGHIPMAESIPMFKLISDPSQLPQIRSVILVCRSGRRSTRAIAFLKEHGFNNLRILGGGMVAWENANLLEALDG